jgi:hypothetical protein
MRKILYYTARQKLVARTEHARETQRTYILSVYQPLSSETGLWGVGPSNMAT